MVVDNESPADAKRGLEMMKVASSKEKALLKEIFSSKNHLNTF